MALRRVTDERVLTLTITDEAMVVPALAPFVKRLAEVPAQGDGVIIKRIGAVTKGGTGTGTLVAGGQYSGLTSRTITVVIDTAGDIGAATLKWSDDGGATWKEQLVSIADTDPIDLELGLTVSAVAGPSGTDFQNGDTFTFTAAVWSEVAYVPTTVTEYQVDYSNGDVLFHSGAAGMTVYAAYEGRGSVVCADDVNQLIDAIESGAMAVCGVDTSELVANKVVFVDDDGSYAFGNATDSTKPAMGFVRTVGVTDGEIVLSGLLGGFVDLVPGQVYYLATTDGEITATPPASSGNIRQKVGRAFSATILNVRISDEISTV